jgi:hypothetical protein
MELIEIESGVVEDKGVGSTVRVSETALASSLAMALLEAMIVDVEDVALDDDDHADHKGDAEDDDEDATLEDVSAAATAVSRDVVLEEDHAVHADHKGDPEDDAEEDDEDATLEDVSAAATTLSRDVDADAIEIVLEIQAVSLPYWRRWRCW